LPSPNNKTPSRLNKPTQDKGQTERPTAIRRHPTVPVPGAPTLGIQDHAQARLRLPG
jgi:hypothetical protein